MFYHFSYSWMLEVIKFKILAFHTTIKIEKCLVLLFNIIEIIVCWHILIFKLILFLLNTINDIGLRYNSFSKANGLFLFTHCIL